MSLKFWVRSWLILGAIWLAIDALVHLFNIRLADTLSIWPTSAVSFTGFISQLYASFVLLLVFMIFEIQRDIKKYSKLVLVMGIWALLHGTYLGYQVLVGLPNNFQNIPSLSVWLPFYTELEALQSILLLLFGTIVILWRFKNGKNN